MNTDTKPQRHQAQEGIEAKNKVGKNGTGVRSGFIYSTLLGQKRYMHTLHAVKGARVVDCAAGNGWGSFLISKAGAAEVVGVELSEDGYSVASHYYKSDNIRYINSSLENADLDSHSFDVLVSFETIEHVQDPVGFLKKMRGLARSDGVLFLSTPNGLACKNVNASPYNPYHLDEYTRVQLEEMFAASGWSVKEYRGQHIMRSKEELVQYKIFLKKYWTHMDRVRRFGILFRCFSFLFRNLRPSDEPAYSGGCDPMLVPDGCEPAYHFFVLCTK